MKATVNVLVNVAVSEVVRASNHLTVKVLITPLKFIVGIQLNKYSHIPTTDVYVVGVFAHI